MTTLLNSEDIKKLIPHRPPVLMIDKIISLEPGKNIKAVKNISINEDFFRGHFPGNPVMPGTMIAEGMAQAACVLFRKTYPDLDIKTYYLGSFKVRFRNPAFPGDKLILNIETIKMPEIGGVFKISASVENKEIARGEMSFMVK